MINFKVISQVLVGFVSLSCLAAEPLKFDDFVPPECKDKEVNPSKIISDALSSTSQDDFLTKLGPNSLRAFSFVTKSENGEFAATTPGFPPAISEDWPGPVRASLDGKVVMRYTCDRKSKAYGTVDIFIKKDEYPGIETHRITFKQNAAHPDHNQDPQTCLQCHADASKTKTNASDFRPIWTNYSTWNNFLGKDDDQLSYNEATILGKIKTRAAAQDPCYSTLPWADKSTLSVTEPDIYPYTKEYSPPTLEQRANLNLTKIFSRQSSEVATTQFLKANPLKAELAAVTSLLKVEDCFSDLPRDDFDFVKSDDEIALRTAGAAPLKSPAVVNGEPLKSQFFSGSTGIDEFFNAALVQNFVKRDKSWDFLKGAGILSFTKEGDVYSIGKTAGSFKIFGKDPSCFWRGSDLFSRIDGPVRKNVCSNLVSKAHKIIEKLRNSSKKLVSPTVSSPSGKSSTNEAR